MSPARLFSHVALPFCSEGAGQEEYSPQSPGGSGQVPRRGTEWGKLVPECQLSTPWGRFPRGPRFSSFPHLKLRAGTSDSNRYCAGALGAGRARGPRGCGPHRRGVVLRHCVHKKRYHVLRCLQCDYGVSSPVCNIRGGAVGTSCFASPRRAFEKTTLPKRVTGRWLVLLPSAAGDKGGQ